MARPIKTIQTLQPLKEKIERDKAFEIEANNRAARKAVKVARFDQLVARTPRPRIPEIKKATAGLTDRIKRLCRDSGYHVLTKRDVEKELNPLSLQQREDLIEEKEDKAIEEAIARANTSHIESNDSPRITMSDFPKVVRDAAKKRINYTTISSIMTERFLRKKGIVGHIELSGGLNKIKCPSVKAAILNSEIISEFSKPRITKHDVISRRNVPKGHSGYDDGKPVEIIWTQKQADAWEARNARSRGGVGGDLNLGVQLLRKELLKAVQEMTS